MIDPKKIAEWEKLLVFDYLARTQGGSKPDSLFALAMEATASLLAERGELLTLLREIEWEGGASSGDPRCMFCQGHREHETIWREADPERPGETRRRIQPSGHARDCRLAAATGDERRKG